MVLGVDTQHLAWFRPAVSPVPTIAASPHTDIALAMSGQSPGMRMNLIAANDLALHWVQPPPASVMSLEELQLVAGARCALLYGGTPQDWWITGDWSTRNPFVCAALPWSVVLPIQEQLTQLGFAAQWHTAWSLLCRVKASSFPSEGWSAMRSPARVVLWRCSGGRVNSLATLALDPHSKSPVATQQALRHMQIESTRTGCNADGPLRWLNLQDSDGGADLTGVQPVRLDWGQAPNGEPSEASTALRLGSLLDGRKR